MGCFHVQIIVVRPEVACLFLVSIVCWDYVKWAGYVDLRLSSDMDMTMNVDKWDRAIFQCYD